MRSQGEFSKKELYELQTESNAIAFADAVGTTVEVLKWFINEKGVTYVFGKNGDVYATTSVTVQDKLCTAEDLGLIIERITIKQEKCKNGQGRYITCVCDVHE